MSATDLFVAAVALACCHSHWWCFCLGRRLRRMEKQGKLDQSTGLGLGVVAGPGLVTGPKHAAHGEDLGQSSLGAATQDPASKQLSDAVPLPIYEETATATFTPAAQAALAASSMNVPGSAAERAVQAKADGERIWLKREAVGWTRRKLAEVCREADVTIRDLELGRRPVSATTLAQIEACLDAELAKLGLTVKAW